MGQFDTVYTGEVLIDSQTVPVSVRLASRYSLWIVEAHPLGSEGALSPTTQSIDRVAVHVGNKTIETGPCTVIETTEVPQLSLRVAPVRSIYNFEKTFSGSRIMTLDSTLIDLPLVLTYKNEIKETFVRFVVDLTYDLSTYKSTFDDIEREISAEPDDVVAVVRQGILDSMSGTLLSYLDEKYDQLRKLTRNYTQEEHEHHGFYFRKQLWHVILSAPIMTRTNLKPRGYIGDSEMMQMIYHNDFEGATIFGKIIHKHAIKQPAAEAVRNRRAGLARVLRGHTASREDAVTTGKKLAVLSVACGPAMELNEILKTADAFDYYEFSFLDQDEQALQEAATLIDSLEKRSGKKTSVRFIQDSVRTMLFTKELKEKWGQFDFIYSMGLFDYLSRPVASAVLKKLYNLLLPGGEMVIGNFSAENPTMIYMAYWMDWTILYRTEADMVALTEDLEGATVMIDRDKTGIQLFLKIKKAAG